MEDDIFDEDSSELEVMAHDWNKVRQARLQDGFVRGATDGQEDTLQNGFDSGFKQGVLSSCLLSKIRGILNALMAYRAAYEGHPITDDIILDAQHLLDDISRLEADCVADDFFSMKINPVIDPDPISEGDLFEVDDSLADLSMETDEKLKCRSCSCGHNSNKSPENYCKNKDVSKQLPRSTDSQQSDCSGRLNINGLNLQDAKRLLFSCPEITDVVQRCKHILKRLHWSDDTIDKLF